MNLKIVLSKIDTYSDKLLHGRSPSLWRSAATPWHYDAVQVRPSTPSRMEDLPAQPLRRNCLDGSLRCTSFRLIYGPTTTTGRTRLTSISPRGPLTKSENESARSGFSQISTLPT